MLKYDRIEIRSFRQFEDQKLHVGKLLTVLAGRNRTGKSTILGILGNAGELKNNKGVSLLGGPFQAKFGDLFKATKKFDPPGSDRFRVYLRDSASGEDEVDVRQFRTSWPKNRFRVIPYKRLGQGRKTETKFKLPVIYLGLSRLFPVGESKSLPKNAKTVPFPTEDDRNWFLEKYNEVLGNIDVRDVTTYSLEELSMKSKHGTGVTTNRYDYVANSAGEDNVGQILLAILSFKTLKMKLGNDWQGGLLLIDELEGALHGHAQEVLFGILLKEARSTGFQVVVTTHSPLILELASEKIRYNPRNESSPSQNVELYYLKRDAVSDNVQLTRSPTLQHMMNDLALTPATKQRLVMLCTEDAEGRWFFEKLIGGYNVRFRYPQRSIGCEQLTDMYNYASDYFDDKLVVFDGDAASAINRIDGKNLERLNNVLQLPGNNASPEKLLYTFLKALDPKSHFWNKAEKHGFTKELLHARGPETSEYEHLGAEREKFKAWFNDYKACFEDAGLMDEWMAQNSDCVNDFRHEFVQAYNATAARLGLDSLEEQELPNTPVHSEV